MIDEVYEEVVETPIFQTETYTEYEDELTWLEDGTQTVHRVAKEKTRQIPVMEQVQVTQEDGTTQTEERQQTVTTTETKRYKFQK